MKKVMWFRWDTCRVVVVTYFNVVVAGLLSSLWLGKVVCGHGDGRANNGSAGRG